MISPNSLRAAAAKNRRPKQPSLPLTGVRRSPRQLHIASPATAGVEGSGRRLWFTSTDIAGKTDRQRQSIPPSTGERRSPQPRHDASSAAAAGNKGSRHLHSSSNDIAGTHSKRSSLPFSGDRRSPRQRRIASSAAAGVAGTDRFDNLMTEATRALSFTSPTAIEGRTPAASIYRSKMLSGSKRKSHVATFPNMSGRKRKKMRGLSPSTDGDKAMEEEYIDAEDDKDCDYIPVTNAAMDSMMEGVIEEDITTDRMAALVESHYRIFMERAFPPEAEEVDFDNPQKKSASILACRPQSELDYIKYVVTNWQFGVEVKTMPPGPEKDQLVDFRRLHPRGNKYIHQYFVEEISVPGDDVPQIIVRRKEKGRNEGKDRIVVSREMVFDAIDEWHRGNGHMGQERTWKYCKTKYYNVTERLVRIYSETCHICMKKNPVTRQLKGSIKPILSWDWRDRFQIDLIDFRKLRKRDPFGVLMRWVLSKKDHASGLAYLCALPRKRPKLVAYKLQEIFGTIGYPKIFHTDNGKEFTARAIVAFLRDLNPNILSVTGRPRRPRDQGSVENMNKLVKRVLGSVLAERRLAGESTNWTECLGSVAAVINSQAGRGKNDVSAYKSVFGQEFDHQFSCSKEDARKCWTVDELMKVTNNNEFNNNVEREYNLHVDRDDNSSDVDDYFSDDELPADETDEVSDDYFYAHLMDDTMDINTNYDDAEEDDRKPAAKTMPHSVTKHDAELDDYKPAAKLGNVSSPTHDDDERKPAAKHSNSDKEEIEARKKEEIESWPLPRSEWGRVSSGYALLSIKEGWVRQSQLSRGDTTNDDDDNVLTCRLYCPDCNAVSGGAPRIVLVGNTTYIEKLRSTSVWFSHGFINGFIALVEHDAHIIQQRYKTHDHKILLVYSDYTTKGPFSSADVIDYGLATHFVSVAFQSAHFVVLYYDIYQREVTVFDGLSTSITIWAKQIIHTIKAYGLMSPNASCHQEMTEDWLIMDDGERRRNMKLELCFDDLGPPWTVVNDQSYKQSDGVNCGPIACLKVMELYGLLESGSIKKIGQDNGGYRRIVMDAYTTFCERYDSALKAQFRTADKLKTIRDKPETRSTTDIAREEAMNKKNLKQQTNAKKMMDRAGKAAIDAGAAPGAVVTLRVDYRTHSHAQGLIAIVYNVKKTGGILVCCEHGVITHSGSKGDYWVPVDKYTVVAKKDESIPLTAELAAVRQLVVTGNYKPRNCRTISYAKLHEICINATSPIKRNKGCKCKRGLCGKGCGCRKNGVSCHSGCSCLGNCCE